MQLTSDLSSSANQGEFVASFFYSCDTRLFGGFFWTMAKLGPLANRDSCTGVRDAGKVDDPLLFVVGIDACMPGSAVVVAGCH